MTTSATPLGPTVSFALNLAIPDTEPQPRKSTADSTRQGRKDPTTNASPASQPSHHPDSTRNRSGQLQHRRRAWRAKVALPPPSDNLSTSHPTTNGAQPSDSTRPRRQSTTILTPEAVQAVVRHLRQPTTTSTPTTHPNLSPVQANSLPTSEAPLCPTLRHHLISRMHLHSLAEIQHRVLNAVRNADQPNIPDHTNNQSAHLVHDDCDVLAHSETGSGKTLAFLLPIAEALLNRRKKVDRTLDGTLALILVPTRELARQVGNVAENLFRPWHWIVVGVLSGGEKRKAEKARLRKGLTVLVGTPGRVLDHLRGTRSFQIAHCEWLVLDEVDRLLDLGFEASIREIIRALERYSNTLPGRNQHQEQAHEVRTVGRKRRRNILLSATLRDDVRKLAEQYLTNPVQVTVETVAVTGRSQDAPDDGVEGLDSLEKHHKTMQVPLALRQCCCLVEQKHRLVALVCLVHLLTSPSIPNEGPRETAGRAKIVLFVSTRDSVEFHYEALRRVSQEDEALGAGVGHVLREIPLFKLHGSMEQSERRRQFDGFRNETSPHSILICTDVAARGLDMPTITHSIQYDPPTKDEVVEYMHRAGRTARFGRSGCSILFLLPSETGYLSALKSETDSEIVTHDGDAIIASVFRGGTGNPDKAVRMVTHDFQTCLESWVEPGKEDNDLKQLAESAYRGYIRAYSTHSKSARSYFNAKSLHLGHIARSFGLGTVPNARARSSTEKLVKAVNFSERERKDPSSKKRVLGGTKGRRIQSSKHLRVMEFTG